MTENDEEVKNLKFKGIVEYCKAGQTKGNPPKDLFKVKFKNDNREFSFFKTEPLVLGEEVEFEYSIKPYNNVNYYTIKEILGGRFGMSEGEQKRIKDIVKTPLNEPIDKLVLDNDDLNRRAMLIKAAFDYGTAHKMTYEQILETYYKLVELLNGK